MTTATADPAAPGGIRVRIQKFGSFLSGMIMPNIPALIAWGIITALFIGDGPFPNEALASIVFPMIHYLLPILIAAQGGRMIYDARGAVVGAIATLGVIAGSDWIIEQFNASLSAGEAELQPIHMFIGAMIMGPLAAWAMKQLDKLWEGKIKAGFEMLVNMFSAGITGFVMAIAGFHLLAPVINGLMNVLESAVSWLVENGLLPLTSIIIEPAKVFFLNNAINHGVLTPLGAQESSAEGKSVLYLLEANPGVGLGVLLAFTIFGVGAARATAPGAALIQFVGGIHEVYFPYVLMKPALLLAVIAGGATGVGVNMLFDVGLRNPAAPGSIIAVFGSAASDSYLGIVFSVTLSAAVTFAVAAVILLLSRKRDLEGTEAFQEAVAKTQAAKGKSSSHLSNLAGGSAVPAAVAQKISTIYFACDAGMGSSAMGASVLRNKIKQAGIQGVHVSNKAIAALPGDADLVITQQSLTERAKAQEPQAVHVSVDNFMNAPEYDEVVDLVRNSGDSAAANEATGNESGAEAAGAGAGGPTGAVAPGSAAEASGAAAGVDAEGAAGGEVLTLDRIRIHSGAATQEQAMEEAAGILVDAGAVTEEYLASMKERETKASTFMGNGLAIPHGTNEAKDAILSSALSVVRYDGGVDWGGKQATFVVGIAGAGKEHLEILSRIARLFADKDKVAQLNQATTEQELYDLLSAVN